MAQNSHGKTYATTNTYVYGNTVRKLAVAEPITRPVKRQNQNTEEEIRHRRLQEKEIQRAHRVNFLYTVAVVAVVAFIFTVCIQYLQLQASVKNDATQVANLEAQLSQLTVKNDEAEVQINGSIDYDAILSTAINELGMVYPSKKQVVEYNSGESEYVKQYQNIPTSK